MSKNKAAKWLYLVRSASNLSQRRLALRTGITNTAISNAEAKGYASAETWAQLAIFFKFSTDAILWLAGVIELPAPPKREIVSRMEKLMADMDPEYKNEADQFISSVINE